VQCATQDLASVEVWAGDPYDWIQNPESTSPSPIWRYEIIPAHKVGSDGLRDFWEATWNHPLNAHDIFLG